MRRYLTLPAAVLLLTLTSCGGEGDGSAGGDSAADSGAAASSSPAEPEFQQLSEKELRGALLTLQDLPPGYSAEPSDDGDSAAKYCGSKPDKAPTTVGQDFTKGGGFSTELGSVGLSQYDSEQDATENLERLREGLRTCKGETIDGDKVTYAEMSTPKLDHPTLGVRIDGGSFTVLLNMAQVGPTVVVTGSGGLTSSNPDLAADLLEQQVAAYEDAARQ